MRYGTPSIAGVLDAVKAAGADKVLVLPLYPQYAASTTASIGDALAAWMRRVRNLPEIRFVTPISGGSAPPVRLTFHVPSRSVTAVLRFRLLRSPKRAAPR